MAPARIKQYLRREIDFVANFVPVQGSLLELGCGYGRILANLSLKRANLFGIDISFDNVQLAKEMFGHLGNVCVLQMDATSLAFFDDTFDLVICVQNGISAFGVSPFTLLSEALRVTKTSGTILFSSYSDKFWDERLNWFEIQASAGLIGPINYSETDRGVIVCEDGLRLATLDRSDYEELMCSFNQSFKIQEVDNSSLFCIIRVNKGST